jgi:hypothetical protein
MLCPGRRDSQGFPYNALIVQGNMYSMRGGNRAIAPDRSSYGIRDLPARTVDSSPFTQSRVGTHAAGRLWSSSDETISLSCMSENIHQPKSGLHRTGRPRPEVRTAESMARKLLDAMVYEKCCRSGDKLNLDDLVETSDIGDWKMSDFETARAYAVAQGWLAIEGNSLRLTTAGLAAA